MYFLIYYFNKNIYSFFNWKDIIYNDTDSSSSNDTCIYLDTSDIDIDDILLDDKKYIIIIDDN